MEMDPTCGFQPSGTGQMALASSIPPLAPLCGREMFIHLCVNPDVCQELFVEDFGIFWFPKRCAAWRFIYLWKVLCYLDPKEKFYALCPSPIVWNRNAQTDSNPGWQECQSFSTVQHSPWSIWTQKWDLFTQKRGTLRIWTNIQVRAFSSRFSGRAEPCRAQPPSLEGTGTTGCLLYHTRLKIIHQNNREQNNFCQMFLSSALGQLPPGAATLPSLSESHLQLQEFPSHPVNNCLVMCMQGGRVGWKTKTSGRSLSWACSKYLPNRNEIWQPWGELLENHFRFLGSERGIWERVGTIFFPLRFLVWERGKI